MGELKDRQTSPHSTLSVYRVQHPTDGYGPYFYREFEDEEWDANWLQVRHSGLNGAAHPEPCEDGLSLSQGQVCGMDSVESLERWFGGCGKWLAGEGFLVGVYVVPRGKVQVSPETGQVVFWADPDGADDYLDIWW